VGGVYTRDVLAARRGQSTSHPLSVVGAGYCTVADDSAQSGASSVPRCSERTSLTDSITVVSSHSAAASVSASTQLSDSSAASPTGQVAIQSSVPSPPVCSLRSPPVKTGIVPPTANINVSASSSSFVTDVSGAQPQCVDKSAIQSVSQTDKDWNEFEQALSEEFISFTTSSSSQQSKDAVSSSYMPQPLKALSFTMPSMMFSHIS